MAIIGLYYPIEFFGLTFISVMSYVVVTYIVTEWRAKFFKEMMLKDQTYTQKATDSLLNFETVKYFNAE